jgi:hypothetical protein
MEDWKNGILEEWNNGMAEDREYGFEPVGDSLFFPLSIIDEII